jgi:hypothetical protein
VVGRAAETDDVDHRFAPSSRTPGESMNSMLRRMLSA